MKNKISYRNLKNEIHNVLTLQELRGGVYDAYVIFDEKDCSFRSGIYFADFEKIGKSYTEHLILEINNNGYDSRWCDELPMWREYYAGENGLSLEEFNDNDENFVSWYMSNDIVLDLVEILFEEACENLEKIIEDIQTSKKIEININKNTLNKIKDMSNGNHIYYIETIIEECLNLIILIEDYKIKVEEYYSCKNDEYWYDYEDYMPENAHTEKEIHRVRELCEEMRNDFYNQKKTAENNFYTSKSEFFDSLNQLKLLSDYVFFLTIVRLYDFAEH